MVYDAVGTKTPLPKQKETNVKGLRKLTERETEIVRLFPLSFLQTRGADRWHRQDGN
jgi:hypothetical protein